MIEELPKLSREQEAEVEKELLPAQALRESLEQNDRGNPKASVSNVVRILKEDPFFAGAIILGKVYTEDLLESIFSRFCVGK